MPEARAGSSGEQRSRAVPDGLAPHAFKPGQSGNPTGRAKGTAEMLAKARAHTDLAVATLVEVARNKRAPAVARVTAAVALLDRGWGKPKQEVDATLELGPELAAAIERGRQRALTITVEFPAVEGLVDEEIQPLKFR